MSRRQWMITIVVVAVVVAVMVLLYSQGLLGNQAVP